MRTVILLLLPALLCSAADYFRITAIDAGTGRGVPLVELSAGNDVAFWTDSNGIVAIDEPGFADQRVRFRVSSHGYVLAGDAGGSVVLSVRPGGSAVIKLHRTNIAERLYRITGEGIYRDSLLTGMTVPLRRPSLNAKVTGQDSVTIALYGSKVFWVWGDTNGIGGELSLACSAATSELPGAAMDPDRGIDLNYFVSPSGFVKSVCNVPGPGMKWNFWVAALPDDNGKERLLLRYRRMKDLGKPVESGMLLWNDQAETFEPLAKFSRDFDSQISIHPFRAVNGRREYLYLAGPYPMAGASIFTSRTRIRRCECSRSSEPLPTLRSGKCSPA